MTAATVIHDPKKKNMPNCRSDIMYGVEYTMANCTIHVALIASIIPSVRIRFGKTSEAKIHGTPFQDIAQAMAKTNIMTIATYPPASASTAPGLLYKLYTSEGGIRVPFIFNYPKLNLTPRINESCSTVMDLFPTILDLAGTKPPGATWKDRQISPVKGQSWIPYLKGNADKIHNEDEITGWELFGRMALRKGVWKALFIPKPHGPEKWQLFNIVKDPGETNDLGETEPEKLAELIRDFQSYALENGVVIQDESMRDSWDRSVEPAKS